MSKSECKCQVYSCESITENSEWGYKKSETKRFRFEKDDDGSIFDRTIQDKPIWECEIKLRGHDLRSIANDERTGKSHAKHFNKVNHDRRY